MTQNKKTLRKPNKAETLSLGKNVAGSDINQLSSSDTKSLLRVLLYKANAIDENGKIRPLLEWM